MPDQRYFIEEPLLPRDRKILKGTEFHHFAHVMRRRKGEEVELVNGQGTLAHAIVQDLFKDHALLVIHDVYAASPSKIRVILAQALPKLNRLDFILEKGTELGVDEFWLFPGQYSVKKDLLPHQLERCRSLMIAAMKQCGRLFLPTLMTKPVLEKWPPLSGTAFFGDIQTEAVPFFVKWQQTPLISPILFFIGPESGFSENEIAELNNRGAQGVKLHPNILRTDTAPLMALSLIGHWLLLTHLT